MPYHLLRNINKRTKLNIGGQVALYLHPGLCQFGPLGQLLPGVDVRVMCPLKGLLQLLQLLCGEGGATAPLLALQRQVGLGIHVGAVVCAAT